MTTTLVLTPTVKAEGPGSRGGTFYYDPYGRVVYGERPQGKRRIREPEPGSFITVQQALADELARLAASGSGHARRSRHKVLQDAREQFIRFGLNPAQIEAAIKDAQDIADLAARTDTDE